MKIAVLLGGTSAERDVSITTGMAIAKALQASGHTVEALDCAYGDRKIDFESSAASVIKATPPDIEQEKAKLDRNIFKTVDYLIAHKFDIAFIALHGGYGENGQLQAVLELSRIPYTGSNSLASAIGMDKHLSKLMFLSAGVPTAPWYHARRHQPLERAEVKKLGLPLVVKPNAQGSTVGLSIINNWDDLDAALATAYRYSDSVLLEQFVPGRELTVTVLGEEVLPVVEIIPESGFYDYESKYQSGRTRYVTPAELPEDLTAEIQAATLRGFQAIGCSGYARIDFRLREDRQYFCLEVNTLPGMTPTSLVPKAAKARGIEFPELMERIIRMGMGD
ncbi:MAG: D-alanine--D-alanine ligase [Calditrichae bacterium]|nr:D-alanine--D-alanine ligase [Calditrichia bacterium]